MIIKTSNALNFVKIQVKAVSSSSFTRLRVDTFEVKGAISSITLVTVGVLTAFIIRKVCVANNWTFNIGRPVTNGTNRILVPWVKCEGPLVITLVITSTRSTFI